jgi:molecular chaperone GrpE (heat shock protein)
VTVDHGENMAAGEPLVADVPRSWTDEDRDDRADTVGPGPSRDGEGEGPLAPDQSGAEDLGDAAARFAAGIESLADRFDQLEKRIDEIGRLGDRNARHVDDLHTENQRLRSGEIAGATAPMIRDLVALHDDLVKLVPATNDDLDIARQRILAVLARWGVERYEPTVGERFDAARHQGLRLVESDDADDATVASVRRCGFVAEGGRVVRPADVEVYRRRQAPVPHPDTDSGPAEGE